MPAAPDQDRPAGLRQDRPAGLRQDRPAGLRQDRPAGLRHDRPAGLGQGDAKDRVTAAIQALFRLEGSRRLHQQLASAAGVSMSQQGYRLLGRIVEGGPTSPGQLASLLELDPAVVARLLRQLEDAGWVSRHRSSEDGRMTVVEVTAEGVETFERMREVIWRHMRRALSGWSEDDVAQLSVLLGRLVDDVQRDPYPSLATTPAVTR